ncbi:MAG: hypothetical protein ACI8X3_003365 [Saprospiraceae bacterium]|jgi:hypothetical protein
MKIDREMLLIFIVIISQTAKLVRFMNELD